MFDLADGPITFGMENHAFSESVLNVFRQGIAGIAPYCVANSLRINVPIQLAEVLATSKPEKHQANTSPITWSSAPKYSHPKPGRFWYRITLAVVSDSLKDGFLPVEMRISRDDEAVLLQLNIESNSSLSLVICLPQVPGYCEEQVCLQGTQAMPDGTHLAYLLEPLSQEQAAAHLLFDLSNQSWSEYRRLYSLFTEPVLFEPSRAAVEQKIRNYYCMLLADSADHQSILALEKLNEMAFLLNVAHESEVARGNAVKVIQGIPALHKPSGMANIEGCFQIENLLIVHGWIYDADQSLVSVMIGDTDQNTLLDVTSLICKNKRPDVEQAFGLSPRATTQLAFGFSLCMDLAVFPGLKEASLSFYCIRSDAVDSIALSIDKNVEADMAAVYKLIGATGSSRVTRTMCSRLFEPVFKAVARSLCQREIEPTCTWFQRHSDNKASVSVIVPLYGNVRFEIAQIASLSALHFPGLEVVFAVDDPSIHAEVLSNVKRQSGLYGLRCAVVFPGTNLGFSGINNFASLYATSEVLLFLNSDCFLTKPATLFKAISWIQSATAGALGFRLLYPSGALQHDGMSNDLWQSDPEFIVNLHPRIGENPENHSMGLPPNASLLTAACLLIRQQVFQKVGGFNRMYLRGDFEDSDLCLKLITAGYKLGLLQTSDTYHLERQSIAQQEPYARQVITLVNSHLYSQRWGSVIQAGLPSLELVR